MKIKNNLLSKLSLSLGLAVAFAFAVWLPGAACAAEGIVYTADGRGNSISALDLTTGQVKTTPVRISPHNVQVSRNGRFLFAVGMIGSMTSGQPKMLKGGEMERGRLLVFDTATMNAIRAMDIEVGGEPAHVIVDKENKLAYTVNAADDTVSIVDLEQRKVVGEVKTRASPHGLRMSPDGREIYVANMGDSSVSVIDVAQAKEVARIPVGKAPAQVGFTPDGARVYVSLRDENSRRDRYRAAEEDRHRQSWT